MENFRTFFFEPIPYLTDLVNHFYKNVVKLIQRGMKKESILTDSPLVHEILHHLHEGQKSVKNFCGRELELRKMRNYLTRDSCNTPLFVFGKGGSGKTALLSQACHLLQSDWGTPGTLTPLELLYWFRIWFFRSKASGGSPPLRLHPALQLCAESDPVSVSANLLQPQHQVTIIMMYYSVSKYIIICQCRLHPLRPGPGCDISPGEDIVKFDFLIKSFSLQGSDEESYQLPADGICAGQCGWDCRWPRPELPLLDSFNPAK